MLGTARAAIRCLEDEAGFMDNLARGPKSLFFDPSPPVFWTEDGSPMDIENSPSRFWAPPLNKDERKLLMYHLDLEPVLMGTKNDIRFFVTAIASIGEFFSFLRNYRA